MKSLSVIILTYNSEKDIYDCLESVHRHNDIGDSLEIIIVDNQSRGYADMHANITKAYPNIIITQNTKNGGYGQGNNVGIRLASAPFIAIMNPDIRLNKPIFAKMIECLKRDDVAMCAGKQYGGNGIPFASFMTTFTTPWWIGRPLEYICRRFLDTYVYKLQFLSGAFFAIRKDVMIGIGMFDENILMYAEENDINYILSFKLHSFLLQQLTLAPEVTKPWEMINFLILSFQSITESFRCWETVSGIRSHQISRSVVSDSLRPHESQLARPPCPSPTPRVY